MTRAQQIQDFLSQHGFSGAELHPLPSDASFRRYIRLHHQGQSLMLMDAPPEKENTASYLAIATWLYRHGYSVPRVLASDKAMGLLLLEDLGDDSFTASLRAKHSPQEEHELYAAAIDVLAAWHTQHAALCDAKAFSLPVYSQALLTQETNLLPDWFVPQIVTAERSAVLAAEYKQLWADILAKATLSINHFVHRDYHADNLMWLPHRDGVKRVGLLDFQDGVYGDVAYDMVSLLEDARRDVPEALAADMIARYVSATGINDDTFRAAYAILGAQRNCKIIGIFVRLAVRDNKHAYLKFLPRVWRHLEKDVQHPALLPLKHWLDQHIPAAARGVLAVNAPSKEFATA